MADCAEGKKLTELRVIDLKTELERRGLDKTGNKAALLERLAKAISDDGENPDEYLIVPSGGPKIAPKKIVDNLEPETQKDDNSENLKNSEPIIAETEKIVNNEILEEPVVNKQTEVEDCKETETTEPEINENCNNDTMKDKKEVDEAPSANQKIEKPPTNDIKTSNNDIKTTTNDAIDNSSTAETNGIDNEDSINLTIGEDEENLLGEETESSERQKADEPDAKKLEENNSNKKGDSKGSGRLENDSSNKEASPPMASTGPVAGSIKTQQDGDGSKSNDQSAKTPKSEDKDKKSQPSINATSRNLWVSGLSSTTRATDLKQIFSKYGKVIGAKVVTNARTPGARCYGYVTMSTSDDAAKCIQNLHRTELHGRVISVEKAKGDSQQNNRKREVNGNKENKEEKEKTNATGTEETEPEQKEEEKVEKNEEPNKEKDPKDTEVSNDRENRESNVENKDEDSAKDGENRSTKSSSRKSESDRSKRDDKSKRSWDRVRGSRSRSREHHRRDNVLSFAKIKEERERQRIREKERMIREEKRRRNEEIQRTREIERRHREEEARLAREREKLRQERERIEQEKAELLRLERERQKMERDKLERERLEIKRQQMRLEETRRPPPPPSLKRSNPERRDQREVFEPERKRRHTPDDLSDRRRYESTARGGKDSSLSKDFKRSEFSRSSRAEPYTEPSSRNVRAINSIDSRQIKERYERPSSTSFPRDREARRSEDGHRGARDHHNRYENSKPNSRDSRYVDNSRASGWHSGPPASKSFNPVNRNEQSSWGRGSDTRWGGSNSVRHPGPPIYQSNPIQSLGIPGSNSASYDRYDTYKSTVPNIRKY